MKIIHLEDSVEKHIAIQRVLNKCGVRNENIDWVKNVSDGLVKIEENVNCGAVYDLAITDMHYAISKGLSPDWEAGEKFISWMKDKKIEMPIIICSSMNVINSEIFGTVWYSEINDWESELTNLVKKLQIN